MVQTRVDYRNGSRLPAQECNRAFIKATLSRQPDPLAVRYRWQAVGYAETNVAVRFGIGDRRADWVRRTAAPMCEERYPSVTGYSARVTKSDGYRVIGSMCCDSRKFVHSFHEKQKVALESPLKRLIDEVLAPDATYT